MPAALISTSGTIFSAPPPSSDIPEQSASAEARDCSPTLAPSLDLDYYHPRTYNNSPLSISMWHAQQSNGPVSLATQPHMNMHPRKDEETTNGLGLDPGITANSSSMSAFGYNFDVGNSVPLGAQPPPAFAFPMGQNLSPQNAQASRPVLALDLNGPGFQMPQQQQPPSSGLSSSISSGLELHTGEFNSLHSNDLGNMYTSELGNMLGASNMYYPLPDYGMANNVGPPPVYFPGTISPSQLPHQMLKPTKSFSDLLLESRQSSLSASSTEHEWNGSLDDPLSVPLARTLVMDNNSNNNNNNNNGQQQQHQQQQHQHQQPRAQQQQHQQQQHQQHNFQHQHNNHLALDVKPSLDISTLSDPTRSQAVSHALRAYMMAQNRLAYGECKIIIMSPKVGQKSYGSEKRFLCPHPQATLIGKGWFTKSQDDCPVSPLLPPRVNISLSGEAPAKDGHVAWTTLDNKSLDDKIHTQAITDKDEPYLGNVAGKNLHISDSDSKRREVKALVTVKAPFAHHAGAHGWGPSKGTMWDISNERVIGVFESKEIKVISKPSKKKSNSKSAELIVQHGSTIALFNRVKSQTSSTRYLSVPIDLTRHLGSDGKPVAGATPPSIPASDSIFRGFTVNPSVWESFIIYLVDPTKPVGLSNNKSSNPGWPNLPSNAIPAHVSPPVRYNSTVVLQSLQTGLCSPVLVIRCADDGSEAVGMDGTSPDNNIATPQGESPGIAVSQLRKVAFEVYQPDAMHQLQRDSTYGGLWLSCDQESVRELFVSAERKWSPIQQTGRQSRPSSLPNTPQSRFGVLPMTPHTTSVGLPSDPSSPVSSASSDYFGSHSRKSSSSVLFSPLSGETPLPASNDGGPVRRQRTGSSSRGRAGPMQRPPVHRKRSSADLAISHSTHDFMSHNGGSFNEGDRQFWTLDVGDVCIWSIVSTEQISYTFYVPPYATEATEPIAPFPSLQRLLPPNMSAEQVPQKYNHQYTSMSTQPLVTFYGKNFNKRSDGSAQHVIYFGDQPSSHNEVRCAEVMAAAEVAASQGLSQPVFIVRDDGQVIIPTTLKYP